MVISWNGEKFQACESFLDFVRMGKKPAESPKEVSLPPDP